MDYKNLSSTLVAQVFLIYAILSTYSDADNTFNMIRVKDQKGVFRKDRCHVNKVLTVYTRNTDGRLTLYKNVTINIGADTPHALTVTARRGRYTCQDYPQISESMTKFILVSEPLLAAVEASRWSVGDIPSCYGYKYRHEMNSEQIKICETAPSLDPKYSITVPFDQSGQTVKSESLCCHSAAALVLLTQLRDKSNGFFLRYHLLRECECTSGGFKCHNFDWHSVSTPAHYEMLRLSVVFIPIKGPSPVSCHESQDNPQAPLTSGVDAQNGAEPTAMHHALILMCINAFLIRVY